MMNISSGSPPADHGDTAMRGIYTWRMVLILTFMHAYGYVDRAILALLADPIKHDLGLSDTQLSLLLGFAFILFFTLFNIPAGILVDRFSRRRIIGLSVAGWSCLTLLCGLAQNFWQLFAARAGVGLAESTVGPATFSLIRQHVPDERRASAFSMLGAALPIGSAMSLIGGGAIFAFAKAGGLAGVPWLGTLSPWQATLVLVGGIGIPSSLLTLLLPKVPPGERVNKANEVLFRTAFQHMMSNRAVYGLLLAYATLGAIMAYAKAGWLVSLIARTWGLEYSTIGYLVGMINLVCGPIGLLIGGYVMDLLASRGKSSQIYGLFAALLATLTVVALPFAPTVNAMWVIDAISALFTGMYYAVGAATLSQITPQNMMGKVTSIYLLVSTVVSQALGPLFVAGAADTLFVAQGRLALGYGLGLTAAIVGPASFICLLMLIKRLPRKEIS